MTEEVEGATEALQKEATEAPTKTLQKGASREVYMCSVCGATVVPETFETDRGLRYKCFECGKFMKPLPLEDVEEGPLEGAKDPREGARRMLIEDKHTIEEIIVKRALPDPL
jgi:DNA-directed RNA polymerase subunit RPC12/RpoP